MLNTMMMKMTKKRFVEALLNKVYGILTATLLITAGICYAPAYHSEVQDFVKDKYYILIIALVGSLVPLFILYCFTNISKKVPINYILLLTFVLCESVAIGYL